MVHSILSEIAIIDELKHTGKNVIVVALTGVASSNVNGVTIHRGFGLPVPACITEKTIKIKERIPKRLLVADVVVIKTETPEIPIRGFFCLHEAAPRIGRKNGNCRYAVSRLRRAPYPKPAGRNSC